jgi:PAS domain S-box-containing protein
MKGVVMGRRDPGSQAVLNLSRKGKVTGYYEGALEILGYDGEELIGRHFSFLFPSAEEAGEQPARMLETSESAGAYAADVWVQRSNQSTFRSHMVIAPLAGRSGRRVGFLIVFWTIEEEDRDAVKESTEKKTAVVARELARSPDLVLLQASWQSRSGSPPLGLVRSGEGVLGPRTPDAWSRSEQIRHDRMIPEPLMYSPGRPLLGHTTHVDEASSLALAPGLLSSPVEVPLLADRLSLNRIAGNPDGGSLLLPERDFVFLSLAAGQAALVVELVQVRRDQQRLAAFERERLGRDLHDGAIQSLYGVVLGLTAVQSRVEDEALRNELVRLVSDVESVNQDLRNYLFDLGPSVLESRPLGEALQQLMEEFELRTGVTTATDVEPEAAVLLASDAAEVIQIAKEALSNIRRHAEARQVRLSLRRDERQVQLAIEDDGEGFDVRLPRGLGRGLRNLEERATQLGGRLRVESAPGQGSAVMISVPLGLERMLIANSWRRE